VLKYVNFPARVRPVKSNKLKLRKEMGTQSFVKKGLIDVEVVAICWWLGSKCRKWQTAVSN
jgi:hypothetical protein